MTEPLPIDAPSGEGDRAGLLGAALLLFSFARPCYSQVDCVVVGTSSAPRCDVVKGGGRLSDVIASFVLSAPDWQQTIFGWASMSGPDPKRTSCFYEPTFNVRPRKSITSRRERVVTSPLGWNVTDPKFLYGNEPE